MNEEETIDVLDEITDLRMKLKEAEWKEHCLKNDIDFIKDLLKEDIDNLMKQTKENDLRVMANYTLGYIIRYLKYLEE